MLRNLISKICILMCFRQECRKLERDINSQTITMKVIERMETELHHLEQLHENVRKLLCDFDEKIENFKIVDDNVIQIDREIGQIQTQNESQMQQLKKQQIVNQRNKLNLKQKKTGLEEWVFLLSYLFFFLFFMFNL